MIEGKSRMGIGERNGRSAGPVVITGGSGFVGTNLASRLLRDGENVVLYDDLSRDGVERNFDFLREAYGSRVELVCGDIRDARAVARALAQASAVYHFAAQVAVTTSVADPRRDFEVNALGTLNVLEAIRARSDRPPLVFTSTNKVYGALSGVALREGGARHEPEDARTRDRGVSEQTPLDFQSPYGCSKGAADQYVLDYAATYGLPATVFRMSCIYGPHQFGTEDQGWLAHFLIQAADGRPITLYGDGKQVRDVLYVDDLVEAMLAARRCMPKVAGRAFNIGGGPSRAVSLLEIVDLIGDLQGVAPELRWGDWRPGDQRYYVSDVSAFAQATGWSPVTTVRDGTRRLYAWLQEFRTGLAMESVA